MSSFDADALSTDAAGLAFLAETIDAGSRSDEAFRSAFDPSHRSDVGQATSWVMDIQRAALVLDREHA